MAQDRRVALITGGSSGIGLAAGAELVARGYDVVLCARTPGKLQAAAEQIGARWVAADAADADAFADVVREAGRVDLLVHAAGVMAGTFVRKETVDNVRVGAPRQPHLGVRGRPRRVSTRCRKAVASIFLSSSSAHAPQPGLSAYSASKAGLNAFAGALAREVERDGVAVHLVTTGPVATPMLDDVRFPMQTLATSDVVQAIAWLDTLPGNVVLPELVVSSVNGGPFAPEPFVPRGRP